ncbi:uncharacterized protein [Diadema antillarum]|uniref:uncharacterized protein n=1 Tax=Diadema antillarum TaxID=105358 RepID=UPI003A87AC2F
MPPWSYGSNPGWTGGEYPSNVGEHHERIIIQPRPWGPPIIIDISDDQFGKVGEDVTVVCTGWGVPIPRVSWLSPVGESLNGDPVGFNAFTIEIAADTNITLTCSVENDAGNAIGRVRVSAVDDCAEADQLALDFEARCTALRVNGSAERQFDFALGGRFTFVLLIETPSWIDSVYFTLGMSIEFGGISLNESAYFLFNISTVSATTQTTENIEYVTIYVKDLNSAAGTKLQRPIPVDPELTDSVIVEVLYAPDAPPSDSNPYRSPDFLDLDSVLLSLRTFYPDCALEVEPSGGALTFTNNNTCLLAASNFQTALENAVMKGESCESQRLGGVYQDEYGACFSAPSILQVSGNQTGDPGDQILLSCATSGSPSPIASWQPQVGISLGSQGEPITTLSFTLQNGTDTTFTCSATNLAGMVSAQVHVTARDYRCSGLETDVINFTEEGLVPPCPTLRFAPPGPNQFDSSLLYSAPQDGFLVSVFAPFSLRVPTLSFRVLITTERYFVLALPQRRKRRSIVPVIHQQDYIDVPIQVELSNVQVDFFPAVFVRGGSQLYVNFLSLDDQPLDPFFFEVLRPANFLPCPQSPPLDPVNNASCYETFDIWESLEDELVGLRCVGDRSVEFQAYQACLRLTNTPPEVTSEIVVAPIQYRENITFVCPIEGAVQRQWLRHTSQGTVALFDNPSPVLHFQTFGAQDQGYYHCEGLGGGEFRDETVSTEPLLIALNDATTLAFSMTYDTEYIEFGSETLTEIAFRYIEEIRSAVLLGDFGNGRLSDSLLDEPDDFPRIVNTRPGSMIIDYVASFNSSSWENETTLMNSFTTAIEDFYASFEGDQSSRASGNYVDNSLVVGSASSCPRSEVSGAFGTLTFEPTAIGETADSLESCQDYSRNTYLPRARLQCMGDLLSPAVWGELMFTDCFTDEDDVNEVLQDLALAPVTPENVTAYSSDLAEATEGGNEIDANGLVAIATALFNIVAIRNSSSEVTANVIRVVDNVLTVDNVEFVDSVEFEAPTQILYALEDQVTLFQTEGPGNNLTVIGENLTVVALQLPKESLVLGLGFAAFSDDGFRGDSRYFEKVVENGTMIYFDTEDIPRPEIDASIYLPEGILDFLPPGKSSPYISYKDNVPISFFVFKQSKLFQSEDQQYDIGPGRRLAVGTSVISTTVEGVIIKGLPAGQEVETVFLERNVTLQGEQVDGRTCVFWEETILGGRWSSEGCRREDLPDVDRIRCLCDHLTSFAVLLDISGDIGHRVLDVLGIIGCVISIICLVITVVTYLGMKKLRTKQPQQILLNLCLALLGLYFVFVIGIDRRYPTAGCVIVGLLIHYFLLASMCWMAVEAANMYLRFVKVLNAHVSKFMLKACLCAWGLPLVVCIIIVASDHSMYLGDNTYCFVSPGPGLYYGVLLLVAVLLLVNFVIFALVIQRLTCRKTVAAHKADQGETWRRVQNAMAISVLLGLTWIFGFLAIGGARIVFNVLFLIFNSLQGFFVFVMFCLRQQEIRDQWRRWLHCQFGEERPGQFRGEKVKAKPTPGSGTGSGTASGTRVTSEKSTNGSSLDPESIQLTSGGTLSTNASSVNA